MSGSPPAFFMISDNTSLKQMRKEDALLVADFFKSTFHSHFCTLFEIFIFCQKFNFDFPRKLSIFWAEKLVKMLWFGTF